jgi:Putative lumazine-binding
MLQAYDLFADISISGCCRCRFHVCFNPSFYAFSIQGLPCEQVNLRTQSAEEWAKGFTGKPAADEDQRKRSFEILDITENAPLTKVMVDYLTWKGIDYIALSKIDGEWKIISKFWRGQVKPTPQK